MNIMGVVGYSPASRAAIDVFLAAPRLMRLGVTEPDGTPLVHPVWYTWEHEQFLLHLGTTSPKRRAIELQPVVYFTIDDTQPGRVFGVRGPAECTRRLTPETLAALYRAKYMVGEAVTRLTRAALTLGGAHALFKTSPLERLFRDGAIAPMQFPPRDFCLSSLGALAFDLDPSDILPPLKRV